jgi:hypothetical protein
MNTNNTTVAHLVHSDGLETHWYEEHEEKIVEPQTPTKVYEQDMTLYEQQYGLETFDLTL